MSFPDVRPGRTQRRSASGSEFGVTPYQRVHDRVLAPDHVARCAVPVDLCVEVILVQPLRSVGQEVGCGPSEIRQRNEILNLPNNRALPANWNQVSGKRGTAGTVRGAGGRVIDSRSVTGIRKIAGPLIGDRKS